MNPAKLQDIKSMHRNRLRSYTPTMKHQKEKSRNRSHLQLHKKNIKYLGMNLTKEVKNLYTANYRKLMKEIEEDTKKTEKDSMILDRKNKYCQNVNTTQSNLHIQCNPYQRNTSILHRVRTNNPKICMEPEKTPNS